MTAHFLGVDLAWSDRARTGLAAVDDAGRLISSGAAITDAEINLWLADNAPAPRVVAVDAPLVVPNASGQRICENLIGKAYGRYNASAHVSNQTKAYFNPPRGWQLARDHGWEIDPAYEGPSPLCLEVYPHPAMVGLWRLGTVIPYKAKSGRVLEFRRAAFSDLLDRLEGITGLGLAGHERWSIIRAAVANATRQVDLERVEDEIDAIFCAHLAWLWHNDPAALHVYGSVADGYIVAPPPPAHPPSPRRPVRPSGTSQNASILFEVVGRPTGYGGAQGEIEWKAAVSREASQHALPDSVRIGLDFEFRLSSSQQGRNEPDLDNLVKSTIDALVGVLSPRPGNHPGQVDDVRVNEIRARKMFVTDVRSAGVTIAAWVQ